MEVRSCGVCKGRDGYKWRSCAGNFTHFNKSNKVVSAKGEMDINGGQVMWCLQGGRWI